MIFPAVKANGPRHTYLIQGLRYVAHLSTKTGRVDFPGSWYPHMQRENKKYGGAPSLGLRPSPTSECGVGSGQR